MTRLFIIGLTGGIACGKSAVAETLRRYFRAVTCDIDRITHWLLQPGGELFDVYVRHFGGKVVTQEGTLNRRLIGEIIFNDDDERAWINSVAHPILLQRARDFLVDSLQAGARLVVLEVPLLFEVGWENFVDEVWAVYTYREYQLKRLMIRDNLTEEQARARINAQISTEEMLARADVKLLNVGGYKAMRRRVARAIHGRTF